MKENIKTILLVLLGTTCIVLLFFSAENRVANKNLQDNIFALKDTLKTIQLKNGEMLYAMKGYVLDKKQFEDYVKINNEEIKNIEKKLGSTIDAIAKLEGHVRVDTLTMLDSIYITQDSIIYNDFNYQDQWLTLLGHSQFQLNPLKAQTTIDSICMDIPLVIGTSKKGQWFATSENKCVQFSSINAARVKQKRWGMGPTLTLGAGYGWGTDFSGGTTNGGLIVGAMLGWSIHYDIWQW